MKKNFLIPMIALLGLASCGGYSSSSAASSQTASSEATSSSVEPSSSVVPSSSEAPAIASIAQITDGAQIDITATVGAVSNKGFVLTDGTASVYVFLDKAVNDVAAGDVVNVKGVAETYSGSSGSHGYIRVSKDVIYAKVQGTAATITPIEMTKEIADALPNMKAFTDYKLYTWTTTVGKSGTYTTYPFAESSTLIEPLHTKTADLGVEGQQYIVTAYFVGYDISHDGFASIIQTSIETPAGTVRITKSSTDLEVGESVCFEAVTEGTENDTYTWTSSVDGIVTITDGVVTGATVGSTVITAKSNTSGKEDQVTVKVSAASDVSAVSTYDSKTGSAVDPRTMITNETHQASDLFDQTGNGKFISIVTPTNAYLASYGIKLSKSEEAGSLVLDLGVSVSKVTVTFVAYKGYLTAVQIGNTKAMLGDAENQFAEKVVEVNEEFESGSQLTLKPLAKNTTIGEEKSTDLRLYVKSIEFTKKA